VITWPLTELRLYCMSYARNTRALEVDCCNYDLQFKGFRNYNSIVIVISKLLKRHSKAKRGAPAYSRALRRFDVILSSLV